VPSSFRTMFTMLASAGFARCFTRVLKASNNFSSLVVASDSNSITFCDSHTCQPSTTHHAPTPPPPPPHVSTETNRQPAFQTLDQWLDVVGSFASYPLHHVLGEVHRRITSFGQPTSGNPRSFTCLHRGLILPHACQLVRGFLPDGDTHGVTQQRLKRVQAASIATGLVATLISRSNTATRCMASAHWARICLCSSLDAWSLARRYHEQG